MIRTSLATAALALSVGTPAFAANVTCDGVAGLSGPYTTLTTHTMQLLAGETVTVSSVSNITGQIGGVGVLITYASGTVLNTGNTATSDGQAVMTIGPLFETTGNISVSCSAGGGGGSGGGGVVVPVDPPDFDATRLQLLQIGAQASAGIQVSNVTGSIKTTISAYLASRGIGAATRGNLIFSTAGYDPAISSDVDVWAAYSYRNLSGDVDGHATDLTFGIQTEIRPDLLIGAMVDIGKLDIETAVDGLTADSIVVGPYFAAKLRNDTTVSGYLAYGRPDYDFDGGGSADAKRLIWGLDVTMERDWNGWALSPFASLSGFREDIGAGGGLAARDVSQVQASVGTRVDFAPQGPIRPYASIAIEAQKFKDSGVSTDNLAARIGAGFSMDAGPGTLSVDFDTGELADGVRDTGISVRYGFVF